MAFLCQELQPDGGGRERRPSHVDTNPPPQSDILVECPICGRKFAKDRIQRHMEVHEPSILPSEHVHVEITIVVKRVHPT